MKSLTRKLLKVFGYEIRRSGDDIVKPFNLLELLVHDYLARNNDFFFIQIGANDGVSSDELNPIILKYHLYGLLVEPVPCYFEKLKEEYAGETQLMFENCAIYEKDGFIKVYYFRQGSPIPEWCFGMASLHKWHLTKFEDSRDYSRYIDEVQVPALTFGGLIAKHNIGKVSLLQIDTEGYDYEVLKMAFGCGCLPDMIKYEHQHLSANNVYECKKMLDGKGYSFIDYGIDTVAVKSGLL